MVDTVPLMYSQAVMFNIFWVCELICSVCPPVPGGGVPGERSARGHELLLLPSAEGLHQGHQHPAPLPEDQHAAGTPDGKGAPGPHCHPQGKTGQPIGTDLNITLIHLPILYNL